MDSLGVLYLIIAFCVIFSIVSAVLIYKHVQEEKMNYYKARFRREKEQEGPSAYAESQTKAPIVGPIIVPKQMDKGKEEIEEKGGDGVAVPALVPVASVTTVAAAAAAATTTAPPVPLPPKPATVLPSESFVLETNSDAPGVDNAPPPIAIASVATVMGGAVALSLAKDSLPPVPRPLPPVRNPPAQDQSQKKKTKKKDKAKPVSDFDDYRNGSPSALPVPEPAPAPAQYSYPAHEDETITKSPELRALPTLTTREGLEF